LYLSLPPHLCKVLGVLFFFLPLNLYAVTWSDDPQFTAFVHQKTIDGKSVEIFDVNVYLERDWEDIQTSGDDTLYSQAFQYWADGIYEMSNGGNYLGKVTIYTGSSSGSGPAVIWKKEGVHPIASIGGYWNSGNITMSDTLVDGSKRSHWLKIPQKTGSTLAHETMHWIYGLKDEYGFGSIGKATKEEKGNTCNIIPNFSNNTLRMISRNFLENKTDFCIENYHVGSRFQFGYWDETLDKKSVLPGGLLTDSVAPFFEYRIDSIHRIDTLSPLMNSKGMDSTNYYVIYFSGADGSTVIMYDTAQSAYRFSIKNPGPWYYWGSIHSVSHIQYSAYLNPVPINGITYVNLLNEPQYQWLNFSTKQNANPHNYQGRAFRDLNGKSFDQWTTLVDTSLQTKPGGELSNHNLGSPLDVYIRSLQGKQPQESDEYYGKTMSVGYDSSTCKYDSTKLIGDLLGGVGRDFGYIDAWKLCHQSDENESSYQPVAIPYMKVELNDSIHKARARQYLQTRWVNLRHNIAVVIDFSGSMKREDKIIKAKEKAKQVVETAYLAHDSSMTVSIVAFSDSVLRVFETDHNNYQQKLQELDDFDPHMGRTAIYDALIYTNELLLSKDADTTSRRAIFLVSDGKDNASTPQGWADSTFSFFLTKAHLFKAKTPIHSFPFGTGADTSFLANVSRITGGDFWGINVEDPSNLNMAFSGSMSGSSNIETQLTFNLQPGESAPLVVSPNTRSIIIYGNHDLAASGDLIFTTPSGNTHTAVPTKLCLEDRCYLTWRFYPESDSLEPGLWTMTASGTQIEGTVLEIGNGAVKYTLKTEVDPDNIITAPQPIILTARLKGPVWSVTGYQSQALLTYPDGSVREIPMNDEGLEGDQTAGDGLYTYTLRDYSQEGHYQLYFEAKNTDSSATYTAVGISIQGTMPAFQPLEDYIVRSSRVDFMVDSVAADDHLSPPEVLTALYQGGDKVYGRIDFEGDEDWFVVEDLDLYKDLGLALYTPDDSAVYTLEVYYPMDINKPLITKSWSAWDEKQLYIPASRLMSGMRVRLHCDQPFSTYEIVAYKSSRAFLEVGRFENEEDWTASSGTMELRSAGRFEGDKSLFITSDGWREITSRKVHTQDITQVSNRLSMRVYVPANPVNPYWIGTVSLKVSIPSAAKSWDLGEHTLNNTVRNMWNLFHWNVPADLKATLAEPHPDVQFVITLNGNAPLGLDYLHFSGDLEDNWVDAYEIVCPEPGCSPETAIDLGPANSTKRFVAYGNIWLKISEFPTDWSPSHLHFGIASEDGQPITGEVEYMGQIYDLEQWYQQFDVEFLFSEPLLIRLNNVSGRPYRIHWWADGYREVYSSDWRLQPLGLR